MRLYIDLSQTEYDNIYGWCLKGRSDPAFAAHPYKLVLEEQTQARFDQINAQFPGAVPAPQPPSTDPLARILAAPSEWAKWLGMSDAEAQALIDGGHITREQKNQNNNWWFTNGVKGRYEPPTGRYFYSTFSNGVETVRADTGGADADTEAACGQKIPGPALP